MCALVEQMGSQFFISPKAKVTCTCTATYFAVVLNASRLQSSASSELVEELSELCIPLCHADSSAPLVEESRRWDSVALPPLTVVLPPLADSLAGDSDSMLSSRVDPFRTEGESALLLAACWRRLSC